MKLAFVLLLTALCISTALKRKKRMLKADKCNTADHPSVVSITERIDGEWENLTQYKYGTGILIAPKWVLTYARIFDTDHSYSMNFKNFKVLAGSNYELPAETDDFRTIKEVMEFKSGWMSHSVALAELSAPFGKDSIAKPAKLPPQARFVDGCKELTVVGWGARTDIDDSPRQLSEQENKLGNWLICGKATQVLPCTYNPENICFDMEGATKICYIDFGHGIFCKDTLVGVTEHGVFGGSIFCESTDGQAYNVSELMVWLNERTDIKIPPNFYQNATDTTPKPPQTRTTEKILRSISTDESNNETLSNGRRLKPIHSIYALSMCLLLVL